jgi:membrane-bound lytic murein transglycosylase B
MSKRFGRMQKASALVPLALLSAAWTASLTGLSTGSAVATGSGDQRLPDGSVVPSQAVTAPASVSSPVVAAPDGSFIPSATTISTATASGIPAAALAAYQRAETVINRADPACHLSWQLVAAIGKIESNHGRFGGNTLDTDGLATPGIYGIPLDGSRGTRAISDTDAGQYDGDTSWDRAVGPMQFIPSTWSVVGVDADADGKRNPQDINDAALATAVYLCSGNDDLASEAGQRAAVFRYNNSNTYVDTVLAVMRAYAAGDFTSVPNSTTGSADYVIAAAPGSARDRAAGKGNAKGKGTQKSSQGGGTTKSGGGGTTNNPSGSPASNVPVPADPTRQPAPKPDPKPTSAPSVPVTAEDVKEPIEKSVEAVATVAQLTNLCVNEISGRFGSVPAEALQKCIAQLQGKTLPEATAAVGGVVSGLAGLITGLIGGLTGPGR